MNGDVHFFVFDWNYPFWANLIQKIKIVNWSWNLVLTLIRIPAEFNSGVYFVCVRLEIPFLDTLGPKNQNRQFMLKFGTSTNSNMQNVMALFNFFVLDRKHPFWTNLIQKIRIFSLSWNPVLTLIRIRVQWCCSLFLF